VLFQFILTTTTKGTWRHENDIYKMLK